MLWDQTDAAVQVITFTTLCYQYVITAAVCVLTSDALAKNSRSNVSQYIS